MTFMPHTSELPLLGQVQH